MTNETWHCTRTPRERTQSACVRASADAVGVFTFSGSMPTRKFCAHASDWKKNNVCVTSICVRALALELLGIHDDRTHTHTHAINGYNGVAGCFFSRLLGRQVVVPSPTVRPICVEYWLNWKILANVSRMIPTPNPPNWMCVCVLLEWARSNPMRNCRNFYFCWK